MELCFNEMTVMKNGTLPEDIALCAQAGFSAVELRKGTLLRYLRGGGTLEALRQTLEEQHVRAASLNALESVSFQARAGGRMLRELGDWCFAACRVLGCGCMEVIASFHVPEGISAAAICRETADSLLRLSDAAADYGVRLALEFMAVPGSSVRTFAQCAEILDTVDRANVGMLLDTWHFCAGGSRPEELSALRGDRLFMVHVSDCPARAPFTAQRAESYWPGEGDAPLEELLRSVRATGYDGPCSVEVMDPNVLALPAEEAIRRAAETRSRCLRGWSGKRSALRAEDHRLARAGENTVFHGDGTAVDEVFIHAVGGVHAHIGGFRLEGEYAHKALTRASALKEREVVRIVCVGEEPVGAAKLVLDCVQAAQQTAQIMTGAAVDGVEVGNDGAEGARRRVIADVNGIDHLILQARIGVCSHVALPPQCFMPRL